MDDDDLRIRDGKIVTDAAVALVRQTVSAQREITDELRDKAAIDERRKEAANRRADKAAEQKKEKAAEPDASAPKDEGEEPPRRSSNIVDIDA